MLEYGRECGENQVSDETGMIPISGMAPGDRSIRIPRERPPCLKRSLGTLGIFSIAYGNLGSSIYYALGVTALYAMGATPFVFMIVALFFICTAYTYAEGTSAIPEAGGSSSFARKAFNELVSFIAGWCLLLGYVVTISIASFAAIGYLGYLERFAFLRDYPWNVVGTGVLLLILVIINVAGTRLSVAFSTVITVIDIVTQAFLIVMGLLLFLNLPNLISRIHLGIVPPWHDFLKSFYIVMVSFTGLETISNLAEESKTPATTIPSSMKWSMSSVIVMFFLISTTALSAMPVQYQMEGYIYSPSRVNFDIIQDEGYSGSDESEVYSDLAGELVYYPDTESAVRGEPVPGVIIKLTKLDQHGQVAGSSIRIRTDSSGRFAFNDVGFGKYQLKLYKKGYKTREFTFDTAVPSKVPFKGKWTTDLTEKWMNDPVAGIAYSITRKLPVLGKFINVWVSILAFTVLLIATNAGIFGVSRLIFSMGTYNQVPKILARVHKKSRTPHVAVIVFTALAFLIVLPADIKKLAEVYAFSALISYTIAHISIIAMRIRYPDMPRPFKIPFNIRIAGREIPIMSVIGGLACLVIWVAVLFIEDYGRNVAFCFILTGLIMYWLYRTYRGLPLTETTTMNKG